MSKPLFFFVMVVLLAGCGRQEDVNRLKIINQGLENANRVIQEENKALETALSIRSLTPRNSYYGNIWKPRGNRIKNSADSIVAIIENLKNGLIRQTDSLRKESPSFINELISTDGAGYKLVQKLFSFKDDIPAIIKGDDSSTDYIYIMSDVLAINAKAPLMQGYSDSLNNVQRLQFINNWLEENFSGASSSMVLLVLNKIENDLLATTKLFLNFCFNKTEVHRCRFFDGIAVLSSSYVKQGQPIEVTAGIGDFDTSQDPRITIDGKEIPLGNDGAAVHRFPAKGKPGEHKIRVHWRFIRPDGSNEHVYKDLKYTIADEK